MRWIAAVTAAIALAAGVVLTFHGGGKPAEVTPVTHAATAAQEARNLGAWLRRYSR